MTAHNFFTIGQPLFWLTMFFLPTLVSIATLHPRYIMVGIWNVLVGVFGMFSVWALYLGWLLLFWVVLPSQYRLALTGRFRLIGRKAA